MWLEQTARARVDDANIAARDRRQAIDQDHARRGTTNSGIRLTDLLRANDEAARAAMERILEQVEEMFPHVNDPEMFHGLAQEVVPSALVQMLRSAGFGVIEQGRRRGSLGSVEVALQASIGQSATNLQSQIGGRLSELRSAEEQRRAGPARRAAGEVLERIDDTTQRTLGVAQETHREVRHGMDLAGQWYVDHLLARPMFWTIVNLIAGALLGALTSHYLEKLFR
jgi:hypothetical protein